MGVMLYKAEPIEETADEDMSEASVVESIEGDDETSTVKTEPDDDEPMSETSIVKTEPEDEDETSETSIIKTEIISPVDNLIKTEPFSPIDNLIPTTPPYATTDFDTVDSLFEGETGELTDDYKRAKLAAEIEKVKAKLRRFGVVIPEDYEEKPKRKGRGRRPTGLYAKRWRDIDNLDESEEERRKKRRRGLKKKVNVKRVSSEVEAGSPSW